MNEKNGKRIEEKENLKDGEKSEKGGKKQS